MKKLIALVMLLPLLCGANEKPAKPSDLSILFTIVESRDFETRDRQHIKEVIGRITIENTGQKPVRVVLPNFPAGKYWQSHANGGYGLAIIDKNGKQTKIPEPRVPGATTAPIQEKTTVILEPGMSIGKLLRLRGHMAELARKSKLVAYYEVPVKLPRGLSMPWDKKLKIPLWRGSITSKPIGIQEKRKDSPEKVVKQIASLRKFIIPPVGTNKADIDAVFGTPEFHKELKSIKKGNPANFPMHSYDLLPADGKNEFRATLCVTYRENKIHRVSIGHICVTKGRPKGKKGTEFWKKQQAELLAEKRRVLADLIEIKKKYESELRMAPWNK